MSSEPSDSNNGNHEENSHVFVQDYLDLLLAAEPREVDEKAAVPTPLKPTVAARLQRRSSDSRPSLAMIAGTDMKPLLAAKISSEAVLGSSPVQPSKAVVGVERRKGAPAARVPESKPLLPVTQWLNGRPVWAQDRFECLLFKISGLTLAIPLVELAGIYPMEIKSLEAKEERASSMGLLLVDNRRISVINTARVVMQDRYSDSMKERFNYVIAVKGMDWGLAVDSIDGAHTQEVNGVQWRSELTTRRWLAGTISDLACAIIEVNQFNAVFHQSPSN